MLLQSSSQPSPAVQSPVITLTLLHPIQSTPVQSWTFEHDDVIRIGRSTDNHVVLYSAVVSRNHVELRCNGQEWEVVSLGANGTYIDGKRVVRLSLHDGLIFRLAESPGSYWGGFGEGGGGDNQITVAIGQSDDGGG
jgi:pSer/pThr/pTyr-binding forkhead associated (FHA) protein